MKTDFDERLCRLDVTEERISELEERTIKVCNLKNREKIERTNPIN